VKAELNRLSRFFPPGLTVAFPLDTEPFITLSITEVVKTLFEAVGARIRGDVRLPAELSRYADPYHRGADRTVGHARRAGCLRLLDQTR